MNHHSIARIIIGLCAAYTLPANAQMQQGYAGDAPQVQVDRSVLEDLKGYEPPPMFAAPSSDPIIETPQKIAPPETPILTTPKAEDILSHPVENTQVITEQRPQLTVPDGSNPLLPMPVIDDEDNENANQPLPTHKPKLLAQTKNSKETLTIIEPEKNYPVSKTTRIIATPVQKIPAAAHDAYRPKTAKTMPAVPPVPVEKAALPSLPPTTDNMKEHSKPTIGERMMDAALESHIESNPEKIKEKLKIAPAKTKPAAAEKPSGTDSLIFSSGETNLSDALKMKIQKSILPRIMNRDSGARIQILSFATSTDGSESSSRRIALSRALTVRDYLLERKIDPSRIDVRALAGQKGDKTSDRVDIVLLKP
jgi:outer membrane protein OmpA-like peptidoglycan-associated protein